MQQRYGGQEPHEFLEFVAIGQARVVLVATTQAHLSTLARHGDDRWEVQMLGALPFFSLFHLLICLPFFSVFSLFQLFLLSTHFHFSQHFSHVSPFLSFCFFIFPSFSLFSLCTFFPFSHPFHTPRASLALLSHLSTLFLPPFTPFFFNPFFPFSPFTPFYMFYMTSLLKIILHTLKQDAVGRETDSRSSYKVGHVFQIPPQTSSTAFFFLMGTVCQDSQDSSCSFFFETN